MSNLRLNFLSFFAKKVVIEKIRVHDFDSWVVLLLLNQSIVTLSLWCSHKNGESSISTFHHLNSHSLHRLLHCPRAIFSRHAFWFLPSHGNLQPLLFSFCDFQGEDKLFILFLELWLICFLGWLISKRKFVGWG